MHARSHRGLSPSGRRRIALSSKARDRKRSGVIAEAHPEGRTANGYKPIGDYGVIGDLRTVALVGIDGSIDFMCFPCFDSPSIFAALLDCHKGGSFKLAPILNGMHHKQLYLPESNILLSRFL